MLKIITVEGNSSSRIELHGQFTGEYVAEVERALSGQGTNHRKMVLELENVTFVDREAMKFLWGAKSRDIAVENLPSYVKRWIEQVERRGAHPLNPPESSPPAVKSRTSW